MKIAAAGPSLAAAALLFTACGGPSAASKKSVNALLASAQFSAAEEHLFKAKETEYGKKNAVLYYMDMGAVLHHAGKYKESDEHLDKAEMRMEELYTKSVTKASGMLLLNDNTADYAGEAFERALTNVFRALNYVFLGKPEEAVVEARKVEQFLTELNDKREKKAVYKDDAFARYLDSLLYADIGKMDDAKISYRAALAAYKWYASDYSTPEPSFDLKEKTKGSGEIVFIHYNGVAPRKISKTFQVAWGQGVAAVNATKGDGDADAGSARVQNALRAAALGNHITVAYPDYVQDPFRIRASEVSIDEEDPEPTQLMEDITAIAMKDLADRNALIKTRAVARATVKFILAKTASDAVTKQYGKGWGLAAKVVAGGAAAASEVADIRGWATLPAQIRMARVKASPGKHSLTVRFKDGAGGIVSTQVFRDVKVQQGKRTYLSYRTAS